MPTLHIQLLHHAIRTRSLMEYELIAYFVADQPLPRRGEETPPWEYTTVEAALVQAAALPANFDCLNGLTVGTRSSTSMATTPCSTRAFAERERAGRLLTSASLAPTVMIPLQSRNHTDTISI